MPSRRELAVGLVLSLLLLGVGFSAVEASENRAFAAEEAYLDAQLASAHCLSDYGIGVAPVVAPESSVVGAEVGGILVDVRVPYYVVEETEDGELVGDTYSEATYRVSGAGTDRVRGDTVAPC
ncbi:hypothetical protein N0B31_06605 [Salinirubellus salinus]|uniref:Uncharacterized protein n=1 Tax=Salinirubellus salinus TaxID=1364945 RepID=A0A9E7UC77_9EURY|nr:hypothetical protein [Salinirubellus salinus]UWM55952.1 hypothetical protein N0B31_06605 [Salinirubellus salinus]